MAKDKPKTSIDVEMVEAATPNERLRIYVRYVKAEYLGGRGYYMSGCYEEVGEHVVRVKFPDARHSDVKLQSAKTFSAKTLEQLAGVYKAFAYGESTGLTVRDKIVATAIENGMVLKQPEVKTDETQG